MEPFKNIFNEAFYRDFAQRLTALTDLFDSDQFLNTIINDEWEQLELKQRMRRTTTVLHDCSKGTFSEQVAAFVQLTNQLIEEKSTEGLTYMFIPDFIEQYGINEFDTSMKAMENVTQFTSCEFGIRPFIIQYKEKAIDQMKAWSQHANHHVRRLSSEGCRPRLPWAMALPALKKDPTPILPILEQLKNDPSEYVRRSVANNLNDITKDNPQTVIDIAKKWIGNTKETDWVVKHASRTLLKNGNPELMELFGFGSTKNLDITNISIHNPKLSVGDSLLFTFQLHNTSNISAKVRLEYAVYYQKANGSLSKKVYKISEKSYDANSTTAVERKQPFKPITTRVFHPGLHQLAIIVNGKEFEAIDFNLSL